MVPAAPMVMVRWVGACAGERLAAWDRATAKSMEAAVANRCAAAMNASASCGVVGAFGLTQQRGDAGQHFVVGHNAKLLQRYDILGHAAVIRAVSVIQETTSSSTWSRSGSLKTSWYSPG